MESTDIGGYGHQSEVEDDDILRYLLSDSPLSADSTPDSSPPHMFEDTPDASPTHWSSDHDMLSPPVVPELSELVLDLNPDMLFGTNLSSEMVYANVPYLAPTTPPKETNIITHTPTQPIIPTQIPLVPIVRPPHLEVAMVVDPLKKNRVSSKKRVRVEVPSAPSPQEHVALPRDTLLNITSQSMERYVENLQTSRLLSGDDQKELKRQKRLIKNRESAQLSRERKRAYIDQLEARIAQLLADNGSLKNDNTSLREALARYQSGEFKSEPGADHAYMTVPGKAPGPLSQLQRKMGGMLRVAPRPSPATATASVCLLVVLFTFGLFLNTTNRPINSNFVARLPSSSKQFSMNEMNTFDRSMTPSLDVGIRRSLLETVKIEENDTYESVATYESSTSPSSKNPSPASTRTTHDHPPITTTTTTTTTQPRHVIHLSPTSRHSSPKQELHQSKIEINKAGVFTVSYSPDPASFTSSNGEHSHEHAHNNTFMLFLDPRPDLDDDVDIENGSSVPATHESQLQVATPVTKKDQHFPPMIISLMFPDDIANGSNPLLLPEGINPSNSLMEITCQVVDISITTSEQPPQKN